MARNTGQVGSRLGSGKDHWPCEVAVGAVMLAACMCHIILGTFGSFFSLMVLQSRSQPGRKPENSIALKRLRLLHGFFFRRDTLLPLIFCFDMLSSERFWYSGETLDDSLNSSANTRCLEVGWLAV